MRLTIVNRMVEFISFLSVEQLNGFVLGNSSVRLCESAARGIARIGGAAGDDRATTIGSNGRFDNTNHDALSLRPATPLEPNDERIAPSFP